MPINFTLTYTHKTNDPTDDTGDVAPVPVSGEVLVVAQFPDGAVAVGSDGGYSIKTFKGYLDAGVLKSKVGGTPGMRVWAKDPAVFSLTRLPYKVLFDVRDPNGLKVNINPVTFDAPSTDTVVPLEAVTPVAGAIAVAVVRRAGYAEDIIDSTIVGRGVITAADLASLWVLLGTVPPANMPPLAIVDYLGTVGSQSAMLALTGQKGDWCVRTDTSPGPSVFVITGNTPSSIGSWTGWAYPTVAVVDNADGTVSLTPSGGSATKAMGPLPIAAAVVTTNTAPAIGKTTYYNASGGSLNVPLLAMSGVNVGARFSVRRDPLDTSTNTITFTCAGGDTFYSSGATTFTLPIPGEQRDFQVVNDGSGKHFAPAGPINPVAGNDLRYADVDPIGNGPYNGVLTHLNHGRSTVIQLIGDSTAYGFNDTLTPGGWFRRHGDLLAQKFDANLWYYQFNDTNQNYDPPVILRTSSLGERTVTADGATFVGPSVTGDIEITMRVNSPDWTSFRWLVSKWAAAPNSGVAFGTHALGNLQLSWSADGTTQVTKNSSVVPTFTDGTFQWIRATRSASTGDVKFYTCPSGDGATWVPLGTTVTSTAGAIFDNTAYPWQLNAFTGAANVSSVQVCNGIGGTNVVPALPEQWDANTSGSILNAINGGPTILLMNGSKPGQTLTYYDDDTRRAKLLSAVYPDVVIVADAHNEYLLSAKQYAANYLQYVRRVKAYRPGVPIIATTQNPEQAGSASTATSIDQQAKKTATMATVMAAEPSVTVLDTQQAYTNSGDVSSDGVHPSAAGHAKQAVWFLARVAPKTIL